MATTLGKTTVGATPNAFSDQGGGFNQQAFHYYLAELGTINSISIYVAGDTGTQLLQLAVWADSTGVPGALLGKTAEYTLANPTAAGWVTLNLITPIVISSKQTLWLGWISNATAGHYYQDTATAGSRKTKATTYASGVPDPFGTAANTDTQQASLYANYTPAILSFGVLDETAYVAGAIASKNEYANAYTVAVPFTLKNFYAYMDNTNGTFDQLIAIGLWYDSAGVPGALAAASAPQTIAHSTAVAWIAFPCTTSLPAGTYWLGNSAGLTGSCARRYYISSGSMKYTTTAGADTAVPSNPFGSPSSVSQTQAIYATYDITVAGSSTPSTGSSAAIDYYYYE